MIPQLFERSGNSFFFRKLKLLALPDWSVVSALTGLFFTVWPTKTGESCRKVFFVGKFVLFILGELDSTFCFFIFGLRELGECSCWHAAPETLGCAWMFCNFCSTFRYIVSFSTTSLSLNCSWVLSLSTSVLRLFSLSVCSRACWSSIRRRSCRCFESSLSFFLRLSCNTPMRPSLLYCSSFNFLTYKTEKIKYQYSIHL